MRIVIAILLTGCVFGAFAAPPAKTPPAKQQDPPALGMGTSAGKDAKVGSERSGKSQPVPAADAPVPAMKDVRRQAITGQDPQAKDPRHQALTGHDPSRVDPYRQALGGRPAAYSPPPAPPRPLPPGPMPGPAPMHSPGARPVPRFGR